MKTEMFELDIPFSYQGHEPETEPVAITEVEAVADFDTQNRIALKKNQGSDPSSRDTLGVEEYLSAADDDSAMDSKLPDDSEDSSADSESTPAVDLLGIYFSEIAQQPLLTRQDEVELAKQLEAGINTFSAALAQIPSIVEHTLNLFESFEQGKIPLSEVVHGVVVVDSPVPVEPGSEAVDCEQTMEIHKEEGRHQKPRESDKEAVHSHIRELSKFHSRFSRCKQTHGPKHPKTARYFARVAGIFTRFKFVSQVYRQQTDEFWGLVGCILDYENTVKDICLKIPGMSSAEFDRVFSGNETNLNWIQNIGFSAEKDRVLSNSEVEAVLRAQKKLRTIECESGSSISHIKGMVDRVAEGQAVAKQAKDRFITTNLRFVVFVAKRYKPYITTAGLDYLDLIQEGNIGLMSAVDRYNYRLGFKFSTMAYWWIRQKILRCLSNDLRTIRIPVNVGSEKSKLSRISHRISQELGREPRAFELAERMGVPIEKIYGLRDLPAQPIRLEFTDSNDENLDLGNIIADPKSPSPLEIAIHYNLREMTRRILNYLPKKQQAVLEMRFGIDMPGEYTFEEVGRQFNVIRQRAHQIEMQAIRRLRLPKYSDQLRDFLS